MDIDSIVDPEREFFIGLASIFNAIHELPDEMPQQDRQRARVGYLFEIQGQGEFALLPSEIARLVNNALGNVPDSMGTEMIEAAWDALQRRDETHPALIELRRRLGPAQDILDGEDAAQELRKTRFVPPRS